VCQGLCCCCYTSTWSGGQKVNHLRFPHPCFGGVVRGCCCCCCCPCALLLPAAAGCCVGWGWRSSSLLLASVGVLLWGGVQLLRLLGASPSCCFLRQGRSPHERNALSPGRPLRVCACVCGERGVRQIRIIHSVASTPWCLSMPSVVAAAGAPLQEAEQNLYGYAQYGASKTWLSGDDYYTSTSHDKSEGLVVVVWQRKTYGGCIVGNELIKADQKSSWEAMEATRGQDSWSRLLPRSSKR